MRTIFYICTVAISLGIYFSGTADNFIAGMIGVALCSVVTALQSTIDKKLTFSFSDRLLNNQILTIGSGFSSIVICIYLAFFG